jgi:hypothetical protein
MLRNILSFKERAGVRMGFYLREDAHKKTPVIRKTTGVSHLFGYFFFFRHAGLKEPAPAICRPGASRDF